ncbi:DNA polymerase III subunit delta [Niabella ginsenosidivorans]|uniref:DNA polymerase III subunit delta n=1 Tax=Niabella ginsenosidivorans TaxID=1176587 RepID=A0A1A9I2F3_9BACT|nr:DNA polymerase III subunit delta [Niabella ginsenosidivorans]ANH81239.1 DNA polymerase III subunit delta [Niabella ginsenosidivorans]
MSVEKILNDWNKKVYKPIYWLEGEEDYYIDQLVNYAEEKILNESEASFNLTVFYGKDANWADIVNTCRKYPMFSDRQVVILKEAQQLREMEKLEAYFQQPLASTIFIVAYKEKKLDARTKFAKLVKEKSEFLSTKKIYDSALPEWVTTLVAKLGFDITPKAVMLLVDHIGNDLARIENEVQKILINLKGRKSITEEDIENYVGISKDFNIFELQTAIALKDLPKAIRVIRYFGDNPKAAPIQLVLPSLYAFFSKVFMIHGASGSDDTIAKQIGVHTYFYKSYAQASRTYGYLGVEKILLLLHQYNLKSIGINTVRVDDAELLKEMVVKIML